jgi:hypothetical protein
MNKRIYSIGCVVRAGGVEQKRCSAGGRIIIASVEVKRSSANSGVVKAAGVGQERKETNRRIKTAGGKA